MKKKYIHFSAFWGSNQRHGGTKRSEQLVEVLSDRGIESFNISLGIKESSKFALRNPILSLKSALFSIYLLIFKGVSLKGAVGYALRAPYPQYLLLKYKPETLFYETAPGFTLLFMEYLKWRKIDFIALPHNIEFMVPNQKNWVFRDLSYAFTSEVECYKAAPHVKVISDYDKSILACLGINSTVFPYYPTKKDMDEFIEIRHKRKNTPFNDIYLALGSVGNKPTYEGMKLLLGFKYHCVIDFNLVVAGYGTELFSDYESESTKILGEVAHEDLKELLIGSKALLINQPQTTGFLTKIIEFNLCGIPILVMSDYIQARNLEEYGVYCVKAKEIGDSIIRDGTLFFEKPSSEDLLDL